MPNPIETGVAISFLAMLCGLMLAADRVSARRQLAEDAALLARTAELPTIGRGGTCPICGGKRCYSWKELGAPCEPQKAPNLTATLWSTVGRHSPAAAFARAVPARWSPLPLRTRVLLAPTAWQQRAGRPVRIGGQRRVVLP
jgi:hypothetical protein